MQIQEIIDLNLLQKIQDSFAEATGLAVITVDYFGNPITEYSNFSPFCRKIRENKQLYNQCLKCDAFGGLEAARRETFFMYRCHTGLVDIAVPIIIKGQLIGSVLVGQAKLDKKDKMQLDSITNGSYSWKESPEVLDEFSRIPVMSYEKISSAAEMMFYVITNMIEKDVIQFVQEELRAKDQQLIEQMKVQADLEKALSYKQNHSYRLIANPNFLFNVMNTMSCLAILENAPKTQEALLTFTEMMKYLLLNVNHFVTIEDEISYINQYVKLQKLRFQDRIEVCVNVPKELGSIKIPPLIIYSIIDNAIIHGLEPKVGNGSINVKGYSHENDFVCEVIDDGVGISQEKIASLIGMGENNIMEQDNQLKGMGLYNVNSILTTYYGKEYKLIICQNDLGGTTVKLKIPIDF
jgi:ligand-binding sensor protein